VTTDDEDLTASDSIRRERAIAEYAKFRIAADHR
jgi:hypothetical protein